MIKKITLFFALLTSFFAYSQIQVDPSISAENAVNNILIGAGVIAENITFNGDLEQIGSFVSNGSNMPIGEGVILGTGNVNLASSADFFDPNSPGPGGNNGGGNGLEGGNFGAADPDLALIAQVAVNDAAILEFDFVANGDSISFNFVFASEEYNEYVCGMVNDAFGFFLSGPGIDGGGVFDNNAVNLAEIPGTDPPVPVTINSVNNGTVGSNGQAINCDNISPDWQDYSEFFIDNEALSTDPNIIEYDGFTVVLKAEAELICGETYHIKMAIADGLDTAFDSAVFLEAGSFESNAVLITGSASIDGAQVFAGDSLVVEGCNAAQFDFFRPDVDDEEVIFFEVLGEAENGVDYTLIPDSIIFPEGENTVSIAFEAFSDLEDEGFETLTIEYTFLNSCDMLTTVSSTMYLAEPVQPTVDFEDITAPCPGQDVELFPETTGYGGFTYLWDDASEESTLIVAPDETTTYTLEVTDVCGVTVSDSIIVSVVEWPNLVLTPNGNTSTCPGDFVDIGVTVEGGSPGYTYDWIIGGMENTNSVNPFISTDYTVFVSDQCETQNIIVPVEVIPWPGLDITSLGGSSACPGDAVNIGVEVSGGFPEYTYAWSGIADTDASISVQPTASQTYTVTVSDQCSSQDATVFVDVATFDPITAVYDTLLCAGDPYTFTDVAGGSGNFTFFTIEPEDVLIVNELGGYTGFEAGFYDIVVVDDCLFAGSLIAEVEVEICDTFIPNVFTPDTDGEEGSIIGGNGLNERFYIIGINNFPNSELIVYNRWGNVVYQDDNYRNTWTGKTTSGDDLADGSYFYILNRSDGEAFSGSITILRKQ